MLQRMAARSANVRERCPDRRWLCWRAIKASPACFRGACCRLQRLWSNRRHRVETQPLQLQHLVVIVHLHM